MKPVDYRNATWAEIQRNLSGMKRRVYEAWLRHGPGTTADVAVKSGISILTFRPRTTDLFQMGLVAVAPGTPKTAEGGCYEAIPEPNAKALFERRQGKLGMQSELPLLMPVDNQTHWRA